MSEPPLRAVPRSDPSEPPPDDERTLRLVRRAVLTLAGFVAVTLLVALVFAGYNLVTDRPAKEMFYGPVADPDLIDRPFFKGEPGAPE
ncbi:MAG: hypothetical protein PVI30_16615 [Myxococcales bacterium]|jgi:hypothetical protein